MTLIALACPPGAIPYWSTLELAEVKRRTRISEVCASTTLPVTGCVFVLDLPAEGPKAPMESRLSDVRRGI